MWTLTDHIEIKKLYDNALKTIDSTVSNAETLQIQLNHQKVTEARLKEGLKEKRELEKSLAEVKRNLQEKEVFWSWLLVEIHDIKESVESEMRKKEEEIEDCNKRVSDATNEATFLKCRIEQY